ncbi:MAG: heat-inducible transcription repressor HrcA, partial [bacterium]|nr:heat-inducible transcription repressor HrcA [bacterium]
VIHYYILTAKPVGSRVIAKKYDLGCSPATIRNVMADLEDMGYLTHPHTSAGRIPTSEGYELYVTQLMRVENLHKSVKQTIRDNVDTLDKNTDFLLNKTSEILGSVSKQLGVVIGPSLDNAVFEKISLLSVTTDRILVVLSLKSGIIKSIVVELQSSLSQSELDKTAEALNSRLSGLTVKSIKQTISKRLKDISHASSDIIRLFVDSADKFFHFDEKKIFVGGAKNIVGQPEFQPHEKVRSVIELIENKDVIVHLLKEASDTKGISIKIGDDSQPDLSKAFSIVSTQFSIGDQEGTLGVIGPIRMWYPKMVPLVNYTAEVINQVLK